MEESTRDSNVEADPTLQQTDPRAEQICSADLVVGILAEFDSNAIAKMCDALGMHPGPLRIAVLHGDQQQGPAAVNSEATGERAFAFHLPSPLAKREVPAAGVKSLSETYKAR